VSELTGTAVSLELTRELLCRGIEMGNCRVVGVNRGTSVFVGVNRGTAVSDLTA